jgi:hypothetical protein
VLRGDEALAAQDADRDREPGEDVRIGIADDPLTLRLLAADETSLRPESMTFQETWGSSGLLKPTGPDAPDGPWVETCEVWREHGVRSEPVMLSESRRSKQRRVISGATP